MLAADGTFIATVVLAVAAIGAIAVSIYATRTSFNAERDALRASVRPIVVEGLGDAFIDENDGSLVVPVRNVGPGVAAIRSVKMGPLGSERTGICSQQVLPYDPNYASVKAIGYFSGEIPDDVSLLIRYEDVGNDRFETTIGLHRLSDDRFFVGEVQVHFCEKDWRRKEPPFVDSNDPR